MLTKIPNGYVELIEIFGDPTSTNYEKNHIVKATLPYQLIYMNRIVKTIRVHKLTIDNFIGAFQDILNLGLDKQFKEYNGSYVYRNIRGRSKLSTHSFGIAIDMLASQYPLGSSKRMPDSIVDCFKKYGFFYGGDFIHRKDPMHFQLAINY